MGQDHGIECVDAHFAELIDPGTRAEVDHQASVAVAQEIDIAAIAVEKEVSVESSPVFWHGVMIRSCGL